jgi:hypothetical protein
VRKCAALACSCNTLRTIRKLQIRNAAFLQGLQQLGWTVGQNIQIDYRWSGGQ